jgi:drug/metabolite transporter (DMT)-like permease
MLLVLLLYFFFGSTFTLGKAVLTYISPILFIGIRMVAAGLLLTGFQYFFQKQHWRFEWRDAGSIFNLSLFLIFIPFVGEFWALQYVTGAKACLLYNLSPFITALFAYMLLKERLTKRQWLGLIVGFFGFIPILLNHGSTEILTWHIGFLSGSELLLLVAVTSACYGWIIMRHLVVTRSYSPLTVNGISMLIAGVMALISSWLVESAPRVLLVSHPPFFSPLAFTLCMIALYTIVLILIANVVCFNLYGILLRQYSPTFISFAGFTTPIFAAFFDLLFFNERVPGAFYITLSFVFVGLWLFYQDELRNQKLEIK